MRIFVFLTCSWNFYKQRFPNSIVKATQTKVKQRFYHYILNHREIRFGSHISFSVGILLFPSFCAANTKDQLVLNVHLIGEILGQNKINKCAWKKNLYRYQSIILTKTINLKIAQGQCRQNFFLFALIRHFNFYQCCYHDNLADLLSVSSQNLILLIASMRLNLLLIMHS